MSEHENNARILGVLERLLAQHEGMGMCHISPVNGCVTCDARMEISAKPVEAPAPSQPTLIIQSRVGDVIHGRAVPQAAQPVASPLTARKNYPEIRNKYYVAVSEGMDVEDAIEGAINEVIAAQSDKISYGGEPPTIENRGLGSGLASTKLHEKESSGPDDFTMRHISPGKLHHDAPNSSESLSPPRTCVPEQASRSVSRGESIASPTPEELAAKVIDQVNEYDRIDADMIVAAIREALAAQSEAREQAEARVRELEQERGDIDEYGYVLNVARTWKDAKQREDKLAASLRDVQETLTELHKKYIGEWVNGVWRISAKQLVKNIDNSLSALLTRLSTESEKGQQ